MYLTVYCFYAILKSRSLLCRLGYPDGANVSGVNMRLSKRAGNMRAEERFF